MCWQDDRTLFLALFSCGVKDLVLDCLREYHRVSNPLVGERDGTNITCDLTCSPTMDPKTGLWWDIQYMSIKHSFSSKIFSQKHN